MFKYFDKTFFKIVGGFLVILCMSLAVFWITDHLGQAQSSGMPNGLSPQSPPSSLTASQGQK